MPEELILQSPADGVLQCTLNRPKQFNALGRRIIEELTENIAQFESSSNHSLIIHGAGRAFCFGADFREFQNRDSLPALLQSFQGLILKLYECPKVTIACINGFATGAGLDLALACDFRLAAEKIKLAEAYIGMGLVPDGGGSYLLSRMIGTSRALEMILTGASITSEQALSYGLINQVHPSAELLSRCIEFASQFKEKPLMAIRESKKLVKNPSQLKEALERERESQLLCFDDPQHQSIVEEFLKKRA